MEQYAVAFVCSLLTRRFLLKSPGILLAHRSMLIITPGCAYVGILKKIIKWLCFD